MIHLISLDQKASINERENFAKKINDHLPRYYVLLETCDRVELYSDIDPEVIFPVSYPVTKHLFRLTSGLESALIGECQILAQVKEAYMRSVKANRVTPSLHHLFQKALKVGKKVRSETAISRGALSHGQATVEIIKEKNLDISNSSITLIGVNNLNRSVMKYLVKHGAGTIMLGNRTLEHAIELSSELGCHAFALENLPAVLMQTDILISATSSPHIIVKPDVFPMGRRMMIIDLAVPRDVDDPIGKYPGVTLYNVSDIEAMVKQNLESRGNLVEDAGKIIDENVVLFIKEMAARYAKILKII